MRLFIGTEEECDRRAALEVVKQIKSKPDSVLGLATGSTPIGMYRNMAQAYRDGEISYSRVRTFNLDEYVGLAKKHPCSYYYFMREYLFKDIDIPADNIDFLDGTASDLAQECARYEENIENCGGIDLQLLGMGHNGHIGFNEPDTPFESLTHIVELTESTIKANSRFFDSEEEVPRKALTMGIKTIMHAKKIVFFVKGAAKAEVVRQVLQGPITPKVPASVLQLHPNLCVFLDHDAASKLNL